MVAAAGDPPPRGWWHANARAADLLEVLWAQKGPDCVERSAARLRMGTEELQAVIDRYGIDLP